jgi:hypothetical protein
MFRKLKSDYILTNFPLIWNTRLVPMAMALLLIHLLFFLLGFGTVTRHLLQDLSSPGGAGGGGMYTFSILCSIGILIVWLVFYLRNNAFKSFYIIDKFHLVKEFLIILFLILASISFFESHRLGVVLKTRMITSKSEMIREANIINLAMAFVPQSKTSYFKLKNCDNDSRIYFEADRDYFDTTSNFYYDPNSFLVRKALKDRDAFSYKNYCQEHIDLSGYKNFRVDSNWVSTKNRWIDNHDRASIEKSLQDLKAVAKKYGISEYLRPTELTNLVFADSFNNVTKILPQNYFPTSTGPIYSVDSANYMDSYGLYRALQFVEDCYYSPLDTDFPSPLTVEIYVALCLTILLLCYRLYSRRIFLFSIIGSIVWAIIFTLVGAGTLSENGLWIFYILLFVVFLGTGLALLKTGGNKKLTGMVLHWHMYLLPFLLIVIALIIVNVHENNVYAYRASFGTNGYQIVTPELIGQKFPIGYWLENNWGLIFRLNLLVVILYTAFVFTRLSKKWHIMPEE